MTKRTSDTQDVKAKINRVHVDVKGGRKPLAELVQAGVHPDIFLMGTIIHVLNRGDGVAIKFGMRVDDAPIKTTEPIEVEINWACIDVKKGRYALRKLVESGVQLCVCLTGKVTGLSSEGDGSVWSFEMTVERSMIEVI